MHIGEFSEITGIRADTLRYYEKTGLILPKREGNLRFYTEEDKIRIETVVYLKDLGFSLSEIKNILELDDNMTDDFENGIVNKDNLNKLREITNKKLIQLEEKETEIAILKSILQNMKKKLEVFEEGVQNGIEKQKTDEKENSSVGMAAPRGIEPRLSD